MCTFQVIDLEPVVADRWALVLLSTCEHIFEFVRCDVPFCFKAKQSHSHACVHKRALCTHTEQEEQMVLWALHSYHYPIPRLNIKGLHRDTCCVHGECSRLVHHCTCVHSITSFAVSPHMPLRCMEAQIYFTFIFHNCVVFYQPTAFFIDPRLFMDSLTVQRGLGHVHSSPRRSPRLVYFEAMHAHINATKKNRSVSSCASSS